MAFLSLIPSKLQVWRRWPAAADWAAVASSVLIAPVMLFPRLRWMWAGLVIPLSWLINLLAGSRLIASTPLNTLLLPIVLMVGVSLWATFDITFSLGKVAGTVLGLCVFLALAQFVDRRSRLAWTTSVFLLGGATVALISLVGTNWPAKFAPLRALTQLFPTRFKGLPGAEEGFNANPVGGTMILFVPVVLMLLGSPESSNAWRRRLLRAGLVLLLALLGGTLLLTQSRGAWLGMGVALVFLAVATSRWARWGAVAAFLAAGILAVVYRPWTSLLQQNQEGVLAGGEISLSGRLEIWSRAVYGIQDFPFTGMGMNAFRKVVHILYPLFTISPDYDFASAHNHLLQAALDLGIPGMTAYVGVWGATAVLLVRVWRRSSDLLHRRLALGLIAGLLAQLVYQTTDAIPLGAKVGVFWWIALALTAALHRIETGEEVFKRRVPCWEQWVTWVLVSLVSISFVGDHPYVALAIGVAGGTYLGFLAAAVKPRPAPENAGDQPIA